MIADTSGLLAAFDPDERMHEACARVLSAASVPPVVSPYVMAELAYLVARRRGTEAETTLLRHLASGAYRLACLSEDDLVAAAEVVDRYRDLRIGLTDASLVVLAGKHGTDQLLTLDERHFRAIAATDGRPFRLLPADL